MGNSGTETVLQLEVLDTAPSADLLAKPLDYIFAEHFRQRVLCNVLDVIAVGRNLDAKLVEAVVSFLKADFSMHVLDEEEDLFPLLRRRAQPEDQIDQLIGQLSEEHACDRLDALSIIEGLQNLLSDAASISASFSQLLRRFAANERQHLTMENAILIPLARVRLTADDLWSLGHRMAQRRGLPFAEATDAV